MSAKAGPGDVAPLPREDDAADVWFPESVAADYDAPGGDNAPDVVEPAVQVLAGLASGGPVLEFAVGTGRIAAPLAARGVPVKGIELSRPMAARIIDKPGGGAVEVTIGDMTSTRVAGEFSLVYLVCNAISNVTTQDGQVAVFGNAAAHLRPGGLFLVEVGLPDLRRRRTVRSPRSRRRPLRSATSTLLPCFTPPGPCRRTSEPTGCCCAVRVPTTRTPASRSRGTRAPRATDRVDRCRDLRATPA